MENLENRVQQSEITTFNLENLWDDRPVSEIDVAPFLVEGLMLKEKPFRQEVKEHDWSQYDGHHVAIHCSTDAIVPTWGFMLIASKLDGVAESVTFGHEEDVMRDYYVRVLEDFDWSAFEDRPVVVKGCASELVPDNAYLIATRKLQQHARKLMYGEPCSSVPLWRRPKDESETPDAKATGVKKPDLPTPGS
jgi:hypothetical protein